MTPLLAALPSTNPHWFDSNLTRFILLTLIATAIAFAFNWWQNRQTEKRKGKQDAENEILKAERDRIKKEHETLLGRVGELEKGQMDYREKFALMAQATTPLLEAAKIKLIQTLTHPHKEFKYPDELLAKVEKDNIITPELLKMLKERETSKHPDVTPDEKLAASVLPIIIGLAVSEKKALEGVAVTTQVVASPVTTKAKEDEGTAKRVAAKPRKAKA